MPLELTETELALHDIMNNLSLVSQICMTANKILDKHVEAINDGTVNKEVLELIEGRWDAAQQVCSERGFEVKTLLRGLKDGNVREALSIVHGKETIENRNFKEA